MFLKEVQLEIVLWYRQSEQEIYNEGEQAREYTQWGKLFNKKACIKRKQKSNNRKKVNDVHSIVLLYNINHT